MDGGRSMTSRTKENNREYMRDYMRDRRKVKKDVRRKAASGRNREADLARKRDEYRSEARGIHTKGDFVRRGDALYDPLRDAPLFYADLTAAILKDPPIGRRAIDEHMARSATRSISLAGDLP
ncbi:hypothetical protein [Bradyrhizobium sp. WSM1417]|uniref:hypothetical protein n=1 Tax=Bradyrhizobium sp. WSM1417 TaxID=754500 RepID=UPI0004849D08|nr:hypothetical protein [Bradyrhizobium sp. WSM1417]